MFLYDKKIFVSEVSLQETITRFIWAPVFLRPTSFFTTNVLRAFACFPSLIGSSEETEELGAFTTQTRTTARSRAGLSPRPAPGIASCRFSAAV